QLDLLRYSIGRMQIRHPVAWQHRIEIGFVADQELAADGNKIGADRPTVLHRIIDASLEAMARNAGQAIARYDRDKPRDGERIERRLQRQSVLDGRVDQAVGREHRPALRSIIRRGLDALPARGAAVLKEAAARYRARNPDDVVLRIGGEH